MPVLNPLVWRLIVYGAICATLMGFGAYEMHAHDARKLAQLQSDFDVFKGGVAALGKAAELRAKAEIEANAKRKANADAENVKTKSDLAGMYAAYASLRDQRTRSGGSERS